MPNSQPNIELVRRLFEEVYSKGNVTMLRDFVTDKVKISDAAAPSAREGLESLKALESKYATAFPNKKVKIDDIFATDDRVAVRWTCQGTHKGTLDDISATNRPINISGITLYRFTNGKISEITQSWDRLGLLEQVGEVQKAAALH
jgi:steroid delta-isomerase-like uncharacterized protein